MMLAKGGKLTPGYAPKRLKDSIYRWIRNSSDVPERYDSSLRVGRVFSVEVGMMRMEV
jgi:hypothetical protein